MRGAAYGQRSHCSHFDILLSAGIISFLMLKAVWSRGGSGTKGSLLECHKVRLWKPHLFPNKLKFFSLDISYNFKMHLKKIIKKDVEKSLKSKWLTRSNEKTSHTTWTLSYISYKGIYLVFQYLMFM